MSIHTSEPPPNEQHPPQGARNPKAEAKAAKAYAKAVRPWYKKKRVIVPTGLVVLALIASAGSSSGTGEKSASGGNSASSNATSSGADERSGTVGQALTNAGTTYRVTKVDTTNTIGDPDVLGARADGVFVVVNLELTNNKDETKTFTDASATLNTSDGKEYETSDKAVMAFGDASLMLKDIQPDLTTRGKLAFEIPPSKVHGSTLVIDDLWGSGEIEVDLGL